jgi:hypothetical protein
MVAMLWHLVKKAGQGTAPATMPCLQQMKPDEVTIQRIMFHFSRRLFLPFFLTIDLPTSFPFFYSFISLSFLNRALL